MCGLKEIFEGAGNFCDKKVPCKSHFSIREKLNLIRFIKTLYKNLSPHPSLRDTFSTREKANPSVKPAVCHLPFQRWLINGNFILNENHMTRSYDLIKFRSSLFKGLQGLGQSPKVFISLLRK